MALMNAVSMAFAGCAEGSSSYIQRCINVLINSESCMLPSCFIRVDIAHILKFVEINIRRRVKEFYIRVIGQLAMATDLKEAKLIIKNIFIIILAKDEGQNNSQRIPCEEAKKLFIQGLSYGVQQSIVNSVINLQIENASSENIDDGQEDMTCSMKMKNLILNILASARKLANIRGSRDSLIYVPELMTPFKELCYK